MFRHGRQGVMILSLLGVAKPIPAAQWQVAGSLGQSLIYNSNISLGSGGVTPVVGYLLTPTLSAELKTAALALGVKGQGDIRRYDDSRWDCDNYSLGVHGHSTGRRAEFILRGGYGSSCSYLQQLTDTGRLVPSIQSTNYSLAPAWTWHWTPRTRLLAEAAYSRTRYTDSFSGGAAAAGFSGNATYTLRLGLAHQASRRLSLNGGLVFSDIGYTASTVSSQTLLGFQLGGVYAIDRRWKINLGGGLQWLDSHARPGFQPTPGTSSALGNTANIGVSYEGRLNRFSLGYVNAINPSALGEVLQNRTAGFQYTYRCTEQVALNIGLGYTHSQPLGGGTGGTGNTFKRDYFSGSVGVAWDLARDWQVVGGYLYRWQQYGQGAETSDAHTVMLAVKYTWPGGGGAR